MDDLERTRLEAELKAVKEYSKKLECLLEKMTYENKQIIKHNDLTVRIIIMSLAALGTVYFVCKALLQFWT